jgi:hypothetical protein
MKSPTPFEGCLQRIERANAHREAFAKAWNDFTEKDAYRVVLRMDGDGAGGIWIEPTLPIPSILSFEIGEALYQLRAALDGCIYAAAILDSGQDPPPDERHLQFPICNSLSDFNNRSRDIAPLAQKRRDIIESVQPYNTPTGLDPKLMIANFNRNLAILNDWARKDRHRKLHVTGSWITSYSPKLRMPPECSLVYLNSVGSGFLEDEDQIARFKIDGFVPGMRVQANPYLALDVGLDEVPPPCAENDTLGNRIDGMIITTRVIVASIRDSY